MIETFHIICIHLFVVYIQSITTVDLITAVGWENTHEGKDFSKFSLSSRVTRFDKLREEKRESRD